MTDTTTIQRPQPKQERLNPRQVIGGTFEDIFETVTGVGPGLPELHAGSGLPAIGEMTGFQNPKSVERSDAELKVEQQAAVIEATNIMRQGRAGFIATERIRYEVAGMSGEDRNRRLHLSADLREEHTNTAYHMAELHRKVKEELRLDAHKKVATEIPSPAKQPSALEGAFEGRSGTQGSGTANLSFQATG